MYRTLFPQDIFYDERTGKTVVLTQKNFSRIAPRLQPLIKKSVIE